MDSIAALSEVVASPAIPPKGDCCEASILKRRLVADALDCEKLCAIAKAFEPAQCIHRMRDLYDAMDDVGSYAGGKGSR